MTSKQLTGKNGESLESTLGEILMSAKIKNDSTASLVEVISVDSVMIEEDIERLIGDLLETYDKKGLNGLLSLLEKYSFDQKVELIAQIHNNRGENLSKEDIYRMIDRNIGLWKGEIGLLLAYMLATTSVSTFYYFFMTSLAQTLSWGEVGIVAALNIMMFGKFVYEDFGKLIKSWRLKFKFNFSKEDVDGGTGRSMQVI